MISDVLGCGPLSMAVLQRSETLVRYLLRNLAVFNEKNAVGQSPLHLCGDWAQGLEILIKAGFPSDQIDSRHLSPLDYAVSMQGGADAAIILLKAGSPLTCCDDAHSNNSTLDFALYFAEIPEMEALSQWPLSPNIACLIENVKWRRESLAVLAEAHLARSVLDKLHDLGTAIDDTRAHHTWRALKRAGVKIPSSLRTRGVSVYHPVKSKSLAMYLYDMGFKNLDEYDQYGRTPLTSLACPWDRYFRDLEFTTEVLDLAEWYLLQGANPLRLCRDHDISTLHIAAFYGTSYASEIKPHEQQRLVSRVTGEFFKTQWIDPVILKRFEKHQSYQYGIEVLNPLLLLFVQNAAPECQDSCCCGCSRHGCTPTTKFLARVASPFYDWEIDSLRLYEISALLYNWYNALAAVNVSISRIRGEVERFIAFRKLGLKHTCCKISSWYHEDTFETKRLSDDDVDEIREEEVELLDQLENMLQQPDSDWWTSPSKQDILLDVSGEGPPPTLRWANLWLIQRTYRLDEEACEEIRIAGGLSEKQFWESNWKVPKLGEEFESWELPEKCSEARPKSATGQMPRALEMCRVFGCETEPWIEFRS